MSTAAPLVGARRVRYDGAMDDVLGFWFGGDRSRWFKKSAAFDAEIRERFGALHAEIARGDHEGWLATARGTLAYVIVLDQLSRNMLRDDARAFEHDAKARAATYAAIEKGFDRELSTDERGFLYMPLMHSESLEDQERSVALFASFASEEQQRYAVRHRDIVARFGRFPHRNAVLGRASTPEEIEFLKQPGSSF